MEISLSEIIRLFNNPFTAGNITFLFETPTVNGDFNHHPDLDAKSVLITFNQSSYRNFADKKLYVRYNFPHQYRSDLYEPNTHFSFFLMFTPLVKGPFGVDPLFDVQTFNQEFADKYAHRKAVLGWTSSYPDDEEAQYGYTPEMVREMQLTIEQANYTFPIIEFDAVHASWSGNLLHDLFRVTRWVMFFTEEVLDVAGLINTPELNRMVKECGLNRTYLKVPEYIRQFIVPPPPSRKKRRWKFHARNAGARVGSISIDKVALLWPMLLIWVSNYGAERKGLIKFKSYIQ